MAGGWGRVGWGGGRRVRKPNGTRNTSISVIHTLPRGALNGQRTLKDVVAFPLTLNASTAMVCKPYEYWLAFHGATYSVPFTARLRAPLRFPVDASS